MLGKRAGQAPPLNPWVNFTCYPRSDRARRPAASPVARQMPLARLEAAAEAVADRQVPAARRFSTVWLRRASGGMS